MVITVDVPIVALETRLKVLKYTVSNRLLNEERSDMLRSLFNETIKSPVKFKNTNYFDYMGMIHFVNKNVDSFKLSQGSVRVFKFARKPYATDLDVFEFFPKKFNKSNGPQQLFFQKVEPRGEFSPFAYPKSRVQNGDMNDDE